MSRKKLGGGEGGGRRDWHASGGVAKSGKGEDEFAVVGRGRGKVR